jgi:hypothetical protein
MSTETLNSYLRSKVAMRLVTASLTDSADKLQIALRKAKYIMDLVRITRNGKEVDVGDPDFQRLVFEVLKAGKVFFYDLFESRIVPPKVQVWANVILKTVRAPNKPRAWLLKFGKPLQEVLDQWAT